MEEEERLATLSPREWLAHKRAEHGYGGRFQMPQSLIREYVSRIPEPHQETALSIWLARYQLTVGEIQDEQMEYYLSQLTPVLRPDETEAARSTFFGVYPTGSFNAWTDYTPRGDRVVMLHEGLPHTLHLWSSLFLLSLEEGSDSFILDDPDRSTNLFGYVARMWYDVHGPLVSLPDIFPRQEDSWSLSQLLTISAIVFVVGHELGHVVLGHSEYSPTETARNHEQEFEADTKGFSILLRYSLVRGTFLDDTYYMKFLLFGPYLALAAIATLGDIDAETHPSASRRLQRIKPFYQSELRSLLKDRGVKLFLEELDADILERLDRLGQVLLSRHAEYRRRIRRLLNEASA